MKAQLEQRLHQLQQEFESGQQVLAELEQRQQALKETLLRISGAMQVLQELLQTTDTASMPEAGTKEVCEEAVVGRPDTHTSIDGR